MPAVLHCAKGLQFTKKGEKNACKSAFLWFFNLQTNLFYGVYSAYYLQPHTLRKIVMKKLLLALSAAAFVTQVFALNYVDLGGSSSVSRKDLPSGGDRQYVFKDDSRSNDEVAAGTWRDYYINMNPPKDSFGIASVDSFLYSVGGKGVHANYHMIFNDKMGVGEITSSSGAMFSYNGFEWTDDNGEKKYTTTSSSYYLETAMPNVKGTVNNTAKRLSIDLYTRDGNYFDTQNPYGQYGRIFSIGTNITVNANSLTVKGRYNGDNSKPIIEDSKFIVKGDVNISGTSIQSTNSEASLHLTDTDAFVESTGKMTTAGGMSVTAGANLYINGGSVVAAKNSFVDNANLEMNGGTLTIGSSSSSANFGVVNGGSLTLKNGALMTLNTKSFDGDSDVSQIGGTVLIDASKLVLNATENKTFVANITGNMSVLNGSTISFKDLRSLGVAANAMLHVDKTSKIDGNVITFKDNSSLSTVKLDGGDSFTGRFKVVRARNNVVELAAGESYNFSGILFKQQYNGQNCEIIFDLNGAAGLTIAWFSLDEEKDNSYLDVVFRDFENGLVKISSIDATKLDESGIYTIDSNKKFTFKGYDINGDELSGGKWLIDSNNYLIYVPEPAEWAMIFGAIAIGLAIYRRRK